jgi:tight adherence protein B
MAETKFMQRAVKITTKLAQRRGLIVWLEGALEKADLPVHPAEALLFYVVATGVLTALTGVATRNPVKMFMVLILMGALPPLILKFLGKRRKRVFQGQLADTLQLLAGSLKAGYSLMQGVAAVSEEIDGPMGKELRRVVIESRLGRPLEDSLNEAAARMESADFAWVVMAINIQREVGGNLAELLMSVADTMIQRERLRRDVKALTAEGRVSAVVIGILPIALGAAMFSINPTYVKVLFTDKLGRMLAVGSVLLAAVGFWWMKKTIEVEI